MIKKFENFDFLPTKRLFLDDWRIPRDCATYMWQRKVDCRIFHEEWDVVRSYGQFVAWIGLPNPRKMLRCILRRYFENGYFHCSKRNDLYFLF